MIRKKKDPDSKEEIINVIQKVSEEQHSRLVKLEKEARVLGAGGHRLRKLD